ncbi:MAG: carbon monoxide dehydrogenase subunit G [Rhodovibrio sp.]|nr:carbon monoxide dehydrogenase subunit G [Rhodovibrio sp.]
MELTGEHTIQADRQKVWESLNDPEILKQCIPGCEEIEQSGENEFSAKVKAKVGPVNSRFSGKVTLSNLNPPESYTISGEGSGGAAGFAKGGADVKLEEIDASQTKLSYKVDAQVGGKLAQLGQRLIQSTANKYAKQFFDKFEQVVGEGAAADQAAAAGEQSTPAGGRADTAPDKAESDAAHAAAEAAGTYPETAGENSKTAQADQQAKSAATQKQQGKDIGTRDDKMIVPYPVWVAGLIAVVIALLAIFAL